MAEKDCTKRAHEKTRPEHEKTRDESDSRVQLRREEMLAEKQRQHAIKIKVVPFDQRADRGGGNDPRQTQSARRDNSTGSICWHRHDALPDVYSRRLDTRNRR